MRSLIATMNDACSVLVSPEHQNAATKMRPILVRRRWAKRISVLCQRSVATTTGTNTYEGRGPTNMVARRPRVATTQRKTASRDCAVRVAGTDGRI